MLGMCIINFQEILKEILDLMMEEISRKCHNSTELLKEMTQKNVTIHIVAMSRKLQKMSTIIQN